MNYSAAGTLNVTEVDGPCIYCWCMALIVFIPIVTLTVTVLVAVIGAKGVPSTVRFVLANILIASLITIAGTAMAILNMAILSSTNDLSPSDTACRVYYWVINTGGTARMSFMATYAVVVVVIIRRSNTAVRPVILLFSVIAIWIFVIIFNSLVFLPQFGVSSFLENSGCVPHLALLGFVYAVPFASIFVLVPVTLAISLPCAAICFIRKNTMEGEPRLSKAMVKFTLFLLVGNILGAIGQSTPVIFAAIPRESSMNNEIEVAMSYTTGIFLTISFIPTPILILLYFKRVRKQLRKLPDRFYKCICCKHEHTGWTK